MAEMIRPTTLAACVLVGLTTYAAGEQHTPIPAIVISQNKVADFMRETERALGPILQKKSSDRAEEDAKQQARAALGHLSKAISELKATTDAQVDKIVNAAKK
jgi:hypothetical protein